MKRIINPKQKEEIIDKIDFNIFKFNNRYRPKNPRRVQIFSCFNEFGCETVSIMYCIPKLLQYCQGSYTIAMGWYGRDYFYRHLVDEFWELKKEFQWLRDYSNAFRNNSQNVKRLAQSAQNVGRLYDENTIGSLCILDRCVNCNQYIPYQQTMSQCPRCHSSDIDYSFFSNTTKMKEAARRLPEPSPHKMEHARSIIPKNCVGIFARGRQTYGRNLQPECYVRLIKMLEDKGYGVIWLGEAQSTLPCPVEHVVDFSRMDESRDLETTFAIVKNCKFTMQFWTASTRIAGMQGVPYILAESPDQIWGNVGQEGYRRNLCDFGPSKLVVSHFVNAYNDNDAFVNLISRAVDEVGQDNYQDIFGLLDEDTAAPYLKQNNLKRILG